MRLFKKRSSGLKSIHHSATVVPHIPELPPPSPPSLRSTKRAITGARNITPHEVAPQPTRYVLHISDGQHVPVRSHCLVGRLEPTELAGIDSYATVEDSSGLISRRHFEFGLTHDGSCWIMDAGSANGTYLVTNGHVQRLEPLTRRPLTPADEIQFGPMTAHLENLSEEDRSDKRRKRRGRRPRHA